MDTLRAVVAVALAAVVACGAAACAPKPNVVTSVDQYQDAIKAARDYTGPVHPMAKQFYEDGMAAYKAGEWERAAELLSSAAQVETDKFPMRVDAILMQIDSLKHLGQQLEAARVAREAILDYPERYEFHVILADYWLWRAKPENAAKELEIAARLAPDNQEVLLALSNIKVGEGALEPAGDVARQALAANPDDPLAKSALALINVDQARRVERERDFDGALNLLFTAASLDPGAATPRVLIGRVLLREDLPAAGRRYTIKGRDLLPAGQSAPRDWFVLAADRVDGEAYEFMRMGQFYLDRDQPISAAAQFEQTLVADPLQPEAWFNLGRISVRDVGDRVRAKECLHALWILEPDGERARTLFADLGLSPEPDAEPSPGFVARAAVGTGFDAAAEEVSDAGEVFPAGQALVFAMTLRNASGEIAVGWRVVGPEGKVVNEMAWQVEVFGRDRTFVIDGLWNKPGEYTAIWTTDDAERAKVRFKLK